LIASFFREDIGGLYEIENVFKKGGTERRILSLGGHSRICPQREEKSLSTRNRCDTGKRFFKRRNHKCCNKRNEFG
jgi:hypothetical protein